MRPIFLILLTTLALGGCATVRPSVEDSRREELGSETPPPRHEGDRPAEADAHFALGVRDELAARDAIDPNERTALLQRARLAYEDVLRIVPRDAPALSNHANVSAALGDLERARLDIEGAVTVAEGPDRAFYLRRAGDLAADPVHRVRRYWQALEWNPYDLATHERIVPMLVANQSGTTSSDLAKINEVQVANYFRFLLEYRRTNRVMAAAAALAPVASRPDDLASAAAAALADVAAVITPDDLERTASPYLERGGVPAAELQSVMNGQSVPWTWLASHGADSASTGSPPHAAYRRLTHAVGVAAALRGDLRRAERQHRLALEMPGAGVEDILELLKFLGEYGSADDLCAAVQEEESRFGTRTLQEEIAIRRAAAAAFALHEISGGDVCGVLHQSTWLFKLGADPPPIAQTMFPVAAPSCPIDVQYGFSEAGGETGEGSGSRFPTVLSIPADAGEDSIDCAMRFLAADYSALKLGELFIEAPLSARLLAESVRRKLGEHHVTKKPVPIDYRSRDGRIRIRLTLSPR
jgi:hypothetical protein